MGTVDTARY